MGFKPKVPIPKNIVLTEDFIQKNYENIKKTLQKFLLYPDIFLEMITPYYSNFKLFYYQKLFLRVCIRFRYVFIIAPRAFAKSFLAVLSRILRCMFLPGEDTFLVAPGKAQGIEILGEKINLILKTFPMLEKEILKKNESKDYISLTFKNGSTFEVVGALSSTRGQRKKSGIIDEVRDFDGTVLNEVIIPLMNVDRRTVLGGIDESEPTQAQVYISSAGQKGSFCYEKLIELFAQMIANPKSTFVGGFSYKIPIMCGLINKSYIEDLKLSATYKEDSFAREYLSIFTGGSEESWYDYDKINKYRKIINPEKKRKVRQNENVRYFIAVDVARTGVNTSIIVGKVLDDGARYIKKIVNLVVLKDMHFRRQAIYIKRMVEAFDAEELIVDGTGLGVGLLDFLVLEDFDEEGNFYPAYSSINDEEYKKFKGRPIIYVLKASPTINSKIHSNAFSQIINGNVRFLITELEAKTKLMDTKIGIKMGSVGRLQRLAPHIETTKLIEEMCNLKIKNIGESLVVEQINRSIPKDRFSSFEYLLWRVKELEEEYFKKKKTKKRDLSRFMMFN